MFVAHRKRVSRMQIQDARCKMENVIYKCGVGGVQPAGVLRGGGMASQSGEACDILIGGSILLHIATANRRFRVEGLRSKV
jgi:hypothetical protein